MIATKNKPLMANQLLGLTPGDELQAQVEQASDLLKKKRRSQAGGDPMLGGIGNSSLDLLGLGQGFGNG